MGRLISGREAEAETITDLMIEYGQVREILRQMVSGELGDQAVMPMLRDAERTARQEMDACVEASLREQIEAVGEVA